MKRKLSIDSAILLAIFTALLYTWSTAHYRGYIGSLKLSADMMERDFHQIIYGGLMISFWPAISMLLLLALSLGLYSHLILPIYIECLRHSLKLRKIAVKLRRAFLGTRKEAPIELRAKKVFNRSAILSLLGVMYIFSLAYFEHNGKNKAEELIEAASSENSEDFRTIKVKLDEEIKDLTFIGCGVRNCAGLDHQENLIHYFDSKKGYSFLHKDRTTASRSN